MQDDNNNVSTTSLNNLVDERIRSKRVSEEEYTKGDEGNKIALKHVPLPEGEGDTNRSWALSEIERTVATQILPSGRQKVSQFGMSMTRRDDMRLRNLTRKLDRQTRQEFDRPSGSAGTGGRGTQLSDLQVRSHSLRMISANAALGSLQFQKNLVLPYMRKSLALDFQKTSLLKKVVGSITSMERAVVSKLEAIKMNTGAAAPTKVSLFTRLRNAVRDKQIDRVATNVSNLIMERHEETWRKHVSPVLARLNKTMSTPGARGGVNGTVRGVTRKLNNLRRSLNRSDGDAPGGPGGWRSTAGKILGGAVRLGQRTRLSPGINSLVSKPLSSGTDFLNRLNPFAATQITEKDLDELGDDITKAGGGSGSSAQLAGISRILNGWRSESSRNTKQMIARLDRIHEDLTAGTITTGQPGPSLPTRKPKLGGQPQSAVRNVSKRIDNLYKDTNPSSPYSGVKSWGKMTASTASVDFQTGQAMQTSLIGAMTDQLNKINYSIREGNGARSLYEKIQTKRQSLMDRLTQRGRLRKGSYEDLMSGRKALGIAAGGSQLKDTAEALAKSIGAGKDSNAGADKDGFGLSDVLDMLGDGGDNKKVGGRRSRLRGRGKFGRIRSMFNRGFRGAAKGGARSSRGLLGRSLSGLWKGTKVGGRGLFSVAKSGIGIGALLGVGRHFLAGSDLDKDSKGNMDTLMAMGEYGAIGASVGGLFGGVGAAPGAMMGAVLGGVVANADTAAKSLGALANGSAAAVGGLWSSIFGQSAIVRPDGTVIRREKTSLLEDLKIAFVGRRAKFSSSGQLVAPERHTLLGSLKYGFEKSFFGDRFSNGEFKQGTSLVELAQQGIADAIIGFKNQMASLPSDLKKGITTGTAAKTLAWSGKKIGEGATAAGKSWTNTKKNVSSLMNSKVSFSDSFKPMSLKKYGETVGPSVPGFLRGLTAFLTPGGLASGMSMATFGWWLDSADYDRPGNPQYKLVEQFLLAYGLRDRSMFKFVHSLQTTQEKIILNRAKPFVDSDLSYMAGRFGFDTKNPDAVNYFKSWYTKRFLPAVMVMHQVLRSRNLSFETVLTADDKEVVYVTEKIKQEISRSGILQLGLLPTPEAYNRYAKIGSADPGGKTTAALTRNKPFDPRDPSSRYNDTNNYNGSYNGSNGMGGGSSDFDSMPTAVAARKRAANARGGVKAQPEYRAAYQKLPANIKKIVDKSNPLQFVLWSTAIQHGPEMAALIFQRDYAPGLDESGYIRSIYQDRSARFGNLTPGDRSDAIAQLSKEQRFAFGIQNGTSDLSRNSMMSYVGNTIDPNGNYSTPNKLKGSVKERAAKAMSYLMQKGYSQKAAAGIVGNLIVESNLDASNRTGDGGWSHGIAQWNGSKGAGQRRLKLEKQLLGGRPLASVDMFKQLDIVDWEVRTGNNVGGPLKDALENASSASHAARIFMDRFERPAERVENGKRRGARAMELMSNSGMTKAGSIAPSTPATPSTPLKASGSTAPVQQSQRAAPKAAPKTSSTPSPAVHTPDMSVWGDALAKSLDRNTEAVKASSGPRKSGPTVAPVIINGKTVNPGFLAMSMKKASMVTGK